MVYVISDIHGYSFEKVMALLARVHFNAEDYLFVLGDVIDRGDDGVRMLQWMMVQPNVALILGNHEAMLLSCDFIFCEIDEAFVSNMDAKKISLLNNWQMNGATPTLKALTKLSKPERMDLLDYLRDAPLYDSITVNGRDYVLTHSGLGRFSPEKKLCDYTADDLLWNRPAVTDRYYEDTTVIFGHTPTGLYGREYQGKILKTDTWINIDAGAAAGFPPVLLCLDTLESHTLQEDAPDGSQ